MGISGIVSRVVVAALAAQALAGCGGGAPLNNGILTGINPAAPSAIGGWVDPRAKRSPLLYVSDQLENSVFIYTYPALTLVGTLTGFNAPAGLCVNHRNGNVWVSNLYGNSLVEFEHGGSTPIRVIREKAAYVNACAVNPKTGDVASVNLGSEDPGSIDIFKPGSDRPKSYNDDRHRYYPDFAAYDASGNVFVDGTRYGGSERFALEELAKGSDQLSLVPWKGPRLFYPGGVQFDGTDVAIGDEGNHVVYRTNNGSVVATIALKDSCLVQQFSIHYGLLIAPNTCKSYGNVLFYAYPGGGEPVKQLGGLREPLGAVVSP